MMVHRLQAVFWLLSGLHFLEIYAYPTINIPFLLTSSGFGDAPSRYKKSGLAVQTDTDVAELEHLRDNYGIVNAEDTVQPTNHASPQTVTMFTDIHAPATAVEPTDLSQELERQLEQMPAMNTKPNKLTTTTALPQRAVVMPETEEAQPDGKSGGMHRPPTLPHDDGGKTSTADNVGGASTQGTAEHGGVPVANGGNPPAPSVIKPFYGAARLAFGQNPEVLPTTTSTSAATTASTSTSTTSTTQTAVLTTTSELPGNVLSGEGESTQTVVLDGASPGSADGIDAAGAAESTNVNTHDAKGDVEVEDVSRLGDTIKLASRRSVTLVPSKTVGQLSAFDMAQYVFWTGDEAGVARAVEELIDRRVLTRENALKFLREVRLGIEYLQQSYTNRIFPENELNINVDKKTVDMPTVKHLKSTATTEKPYMPYLRLERPLLQDNDNAAKTLENLSVWHKLLALNSNDNGRPQDLFEYDDTVDRGKITQFLYTEYTLEDILYKLAKIMFTQSLTHGSDEAQHELQKLTDFLEREGNLGVIPIDLQKKVLHILFRALSDTLAERPELLEVANINLGSSYNRLPVRTLEP